MIIEIAHVNLTVPSGTLEEADAFYGKTLGLSRRPVPQLQQDRLAWFDIGSSGQQVHIAFGENDESSRHPCFRIESPEKLLELQKRIWAHYERKDKASPKAADQPGEENSGMSEAGLRFSRNGERKVGASC
jgi:catechol 2,3-dioxygenase-like lactoylglutathione lyase family enzyme